MQLLRRAALAVLWILAAFGLLSGIVWAATAAELIKPLVVVSGSMEPEIMTGDLLIDTRVPADSLAVGDVVSLPSELTDRIVTHRIQAIRPAGDGAYLVTLKGDANEFSDALDYTVEGMVWRPALQLPGWGNAVLRLSTPAVAIPLLAGLVGLVGLAFLIPPPPRRHHGATARHATPRVPGRRAVA